MSKKEVKQNLNADEKNEIKNDNLEHLIYSEY